MIRRRASLQRYTRLERGERPPRVNAGRRARRRKRYKAFLASAAWKRIRAQKLLESPVCEFRYQGCLHDQKLTVHHRTYVRFGGEELMTDLTTACAPCHRFHDAQRGKVA